MIYIVYLGRKGSGLNLVYALYDELTKNNIQVESLILNSNNEGIATLHERNTRIVNFNRILIISFLQSIKFAVQFVGSTKSKPNPVVIFPMSSPLDIFLSMLLRSRNIVNFRFIHEAKSHLGESWPDPISNRIFIATATYLVTLSSFEQNQLLKLYKKTSIRVKHPVFQSPDNFNSSLIKVEKTVLFVGRIKKYKGIPTLLSAWQGLDHNGYTLRICGEGNLPQVNSLEGLEINNRWLTEIELHSEISRAEIIVFPYLEASQSGLIPMAISKGKKIVVTPVGGLTEQIGNYENAFVSLDTTDESLRHALFNAIHTNLNSGPKVEEKTTEISYFLPLIRYLN